MHVWYVDFSPIDDPAFVGATCAAATGVTLTPGDDAAQAVADTLAAQRGVLVLDTCEHVLAAAGQLAATVLRTAPGVRVLATSRRALGLTGEFAWPVPPLALPPADAVSADEITSHAAVRLFVDRAHAVRPDLDVDDHAAADIAAICLALDGLPLAIELAAARTDLLSPAAIRSRLADRFELLVEGGVDASERQQTLRAAIDWSFELLTDEQRTFFARLGVFAGTFDLDAALQVAGAGLPRPLELLSSLVKQSMVTRAGPDRYRLLDTLRAYALEVLAELDADDTRDRHASYFTDLAERGEVAIRGPEQLEWLERFRSDVNNFRAALEWSLLDRRHRPRRPSSRCAGVVLDAQRHAHRSHRPSRTARRRRRHPAGDPREVPVGVRPARRVARPTRDRPRRRLPRRRPRSTRRRPLGNRVRAQRRRRRRVGPRPARTVAAGARRSDRAARQDRGPVGPGHLQGAPGPHTLRPATPRRAAVAHEGVDHARRAGDLHVLGIALTQIAQLAIADGDASTAVAAATEALDLQERIGYTEGIVSALHVLGQAQRLGGDIDAARDLASPRAGTRVPDRTRGRDVRGDGGPRPHRSRRAAGSGRHAAARSAHRARRPRHPAAPTRRRGAPSAREDAAGARQHPHRRPFVRRSSWRS